MQHLINFILFCQNFKFANFFSNIELLRTSILRYKNSNFRTRTKFEAIPSYNPQGWWNDLKIFGVQSWDRFLSARGGPVRPCNLLVGAQVWPLAGYSFELLMLLLLALKAFAEKDVFSLYKIEKVPLGGASFAIIVQNLLNYYLL